MTMFFKSRADDDGYYSEYTLVDADTALVRRDDYQYVRHGIELKPIHQRAVEIESFLISEVDPRAKNALLDHQAKKKP